MDNSGGGGDDNSGGAADTPRVKGKQGFASMDPAKQRALASKGGKKAHEINTAHEWTAEEAREAGKKGRAANQRNKQEAKANVGA